MLKKLVKNKKKFNILVIVLAIAISFLVEFGFLVLKNREFKGDKGVIDITDKAVYTEKEIKVEKEQVVEVDNISDVFEEKEDEDDLEEEKIIEYEDRIVTNVEIELDRKYYIDKIRIDYDTNSDVGVNLGCQVYNEYGEPYSLNIYNAFEKEFNFTEKNIQKDTRKISFNIGDNTTGIAINSIKIINKANFNIIRFIFILFINLIIASLIVFRVKLKSHTEIFFAIIVMLAGSMTIICTPAITHTLWDDIVHFPRAYNLLSNEETSTKSIDYALKNQNEYDNNSASISEMFRMYDYLNKNTYKTTSVEKKSSSFIHYHEYAYVPSAIVLKVCQILKVPFVPMFLLGKFINLIIYGLIGYYTIKHAKIGKNILFVLFLMPSNLYLACQYSKDPYVTALLTLGVSTFANMCVSKDKVTLKEIMIFTLAILFGSLSKAIYIPFLLLIFLIPKSKFDNKKQSIIVKLLVLAITVMVLSTFVLPTVTNASADSIGDVRGGSNVSTNRQIQTIMEQPVSFVKIFTDNFVNNFSVSYLMSKYAFVDFNHFGSRLENMYWIFVFILFFSLLSDDNSKEKLPGKVKISMLLITIWVMAFIMLSMYLCFTNVASTSIAGVQRRYYLPVFLPILLILHTDKLKNHFDLKKSNCVITILITVVLFSLIWEHLLWPLWI